MELLRSNTIIKNKYKEYFVPTIITSVAGMLASIVDGIIGSIFLGADTLAAISCCQPYIQIIAAVYVMVGMGASANIAIEKGRRNNKKADSIFTTMLVLITIISIILVVAQNVFIDFFCGMLTNDETLYPLVKEYFSVFSWCAPFMIGGMSLSYVANSEGYAKLTSTTILISNAANLIMDLVCVTLLDMGIKGIGLATVVTCVIITLVMLIRYVFTKRRTLHICFENTGISTVRIVKTGLSGALGVLLVGVKFGFLNNIVTATGGTNAMIAFSVCRTCLSIVSLIVTGASDTMQPIVGIYHGEKDIRGEKMTFAFSFRVLITGTMLVTLLMEIFPQLLFLMYNITDPAVIEVAIPAVRIYSISLSGMAVSFLFLYYFMSVEQMARSTAISVVNGLIIIPVSYLLSMCWGLTGIWISFSIAELLTILMIIIMTKGHPFKGSSDDTEEPAVLDISLRENDLGDARKKIRDFLISQGYDSKKSNLVVVSLEEMTENAKKYSKGKKLNFDIRLKQSGDDLMLSICDDGKPFDPTAYTNEERNQFELSNIDMLRLISKNIDYTYVIGLNKTVITI